MILPDAVRSMPFLGKATHCAGVQTRHGIDTLALGTNSYGEVAFSMGIPAAPEGYRTVNAFVFAKDARSLIEFTRRVFGAQELEEALTVENDGLILHSEVVIGDSIVMIVDTRPGWPESPSFLRVYVNDVEQTLALAEQEGARAVTRPTELFGDMLSRFIDPWGNMWWVYQHLGEVSWGDSEVDATAWSGAASDPGLEYIHSTLMEAMSQLGQEQRERSR
jgi:uncharacterized glyoxalase superfamily protein PhnB